MNYVYCEILFFYLFSDDLLCHMKTIAQTLFAAVLATFVRCIGRFIFRLHVVGKTNIPAEGGALLVANHTSYMDFVLMVTISPRPVHFIMNADIYNKPLLRPLLKALHCVPVSPRGGVNNFHVFNETVARLIAEGKVVAIFAEGTVTRTGQILEFKKGVEHLSRIISAPIIPIHFDNVSGTPFSYRAGKGEMIRFRLKHMRRDVYVRVGIPCHGPTTAFYLRQRIKEMEAENFSLRLSQLPSLGQRLQRNAADFPQAYWKLQDEVIYFNEIPKKIAQWNNGLVHIANRHQVIAVHLPKGAWLMGLIYWALNNNKTLVPLHAGMTNEERLSLLNASGARLLITTENLDFTRYVSCADETLYIEEMERSEKSGTHVNILCKNVRSVGKSFRKLFMRGEKELPLALFGKETKLSEMELVPVYASQIRAVLEGLRQMYHFKPGEITLSQLGTHHAYGYVLEWLLPVYNGTNAVVLEHCNVSSFLECLKEQKPEVVIADPAQLKAIGAEAGKRNIPFLTHVFTADVHPEDACVQQLIQRGIAVMTCAGMNESASVFAINLNNYTGRDIVGKPLEQECFAAGSIGKPIPGCALKVCKPNDRSVESDCEEWGEIWIKGPVMADPNEWYFTGLYGTMDRKGFVYPSQQGRLEYSTAC